ncbi:MAG TPA: trypsin-like peptidase domain-containing protein [Crinalium sp.]|jgi:serine protease Do
MSTMHIEGMDTAIATELMALTESLRRSTVQVQGRGRRAGSGSGVIWRSDGLIVTNAHVARGADAVVELWDGRSLPATVVVRDGQRDLAALQVQASDLPAVAIANSEAVRVGELVLAVGNPLGLVGALTTGIVHTVGTGTTRQPWISADVRLAPGNSGGPLADAQGRVIGINTMIVNGLGLAIPSNAVERFLRQRGNPPRLGVTLQPVLVRQRRAIALGLLILKVVNGSLAEANGLLTGDILLGVEDQGFETPNDLTVILSNTEFGDTIRLEILRGGQRQTRHVVLSDRSVAHAA